MSEEGELKKRIDRILDTGANMQYTDMGCVNSAEIAGMIQVGIRPSIKQIIDEMKQDFPIDPKGPELDKWTELRSWAIKWLGEKK